LPNRGTGAFIVPRVIAFVVKEVREALPAMIFFAVGFNLIELTTQLILDRYLIHFADYTLATVGALFVGKAVLLADALPFFRRFDTEPLIQPILFKTVIYWLMVGLLRFLERVIEYLSGGGRLRDVPEFVSAHFSWSQFAAVQIWIFVLFLIYATAAELSALFGEGEMVRIFLTRGSPQVKLIRRRRIRTLVKLTRLTEVHPIEELKDSHTAAHATMFQLISGLAKPRSNRGKDGMPSKSENGPP
jgi:hypothetical protein